MRHDSKEAAQFFIDHLEYLLSLSGNRRVVKPEWVDMRRRLEEKGHWKAKPRGKPTPINFKEEGTQGVSDYYMESYKERFG
jgi:hypothetical protein